MNLVALIVLVVIIVLYKTRNKGIDSAYAKDVICGMQVEKATAAATFEYQNEMYYFCAPGCMESFKSSVSV